MVLEPISDPDVGVYSVWPIGSVCLFDPAISWDTTMMLCPHGGVCHISHRIWEKLLDTV